MKTFITTAALIVATTRERVTGVNDQREVIAVSELEIATFQRIRKLPT